MTAMVEKSVSIIGAGSAARVYAAVLAELPDLRPIAVVDPQLDRARELCSGEAAAFACVAEMLRAGVVPDLAVVCSPPGSHLENSEPLLLAGSDLLLEAPVATTPSDADQIGGLAERLNRVALTAARFRAHPLLERAAGLLREGCVGALRDVQICLAHKCDARLDWRGDAIVSGGGALMDLGPDALDVVECLAGPVQRIRMLACERRQGTEVEDRAVLETEHSGSLVSLLDLSWNRLASQPIARCTGEAGELVVGWAGTVLRGPDGRDRRVGDGWDEHLARRLVLEDFLASRARGDSLPDSGAQALDWLHAAYRSRAEGRWQIA